jgi:hypothetical protein
VRQCGDAKAREVLMDRLGRYWYDDEDLLEAVAEAVLVVPPAVLEAGRVAYTWRTVEAELDWLLAPPAPVVSPVRVRTAASPDDA